MSETYANKINGNFISAKIAEKSRSGVNIDSKFSELEQAIASMGAFQIVPLNQQGKPDVQSPSGKIIYLTKETPSSLRDPYTEWIYTNDDFAIIGETSFQLVVDTALSTSSENPVQNKVVTAAINQLFAKSLAATKIYSDGLVCKCGEIIWNPDQSALYKVKTATTSSDTWSGVQTKLEAVEVGYFDNVVIFDWQHTPVSDIIDAADSGKICLMKNQYSASYRLDTYYRLVSVSVGTNTILRFEALDGSIYKVLEFLYVGSSGTSTWTVNSYELKNLVIDSAPIYEFATPSGYDAHTKSTSVSEVSFVATPKIVHFDGVNVERNSNPSVGDALYIDASGGKHFIDGKTYVPSSIPSGFTSVGAVVARKGDKALILHKDENTGVKFASCWQHEITGLADHLGTEITIQFRQALTSGNINIGSPLVFTPATLAEAAAAIDTHLRANPGGTAAGAGWNYNWHCELALNYAGEESVIVTSDNIVDYRQANAIVDTSASTSGITGTMNMCNFLPAYGDSTMLRVNGGFGYRPGWNFERLKQWATTNTTIATPSSMVSVHDGSNIVSQDQFENNQYCADLRAEYGTFDNYIKSLMLRWPVRKGGQWSLYGTGKGNTEQLASKTHLNLAGDTVDTFSAAKWSASKSFDSDGLRLGDWYMPQMDECFDIFAPMKLDGSDPVNATLKKMTGNALSLSVSRWVPARNGSNNAWIMSASGAFTSNGFSNGGRCEAVALLTINP